MSPESSHFCLTKSKVCHMIKFIWVLAKSQDLSVIHGSIISMLSSIVRCLIRFFSSSWFPPFLDMFAGTWNFHPLPPHVHHHADQLLSYRLLGEWLATLHSAWIHLTQWPLFQSVTHCSAICCSTLDYSLQCITARYNRAQYTALEHCVSCSAECITSRTRRRKKEKGGDWFCTPIARERIK